MTDKIKIDSGFSLIELLVVIGILGIMIGLAYAGLHNLRADYFVSDAANSLYSDLQWTKQKSIGSANSYGIRIDADQDSYEVYRESGPCGSGTTNQLSEKSDFNVVDMEPDMDICFSKRGITYDWGTITLGCHNNACSKQKQITISRFNVELQ